jgi:hypothetical protein
MNKHECVVPNTNVDFLLSQNFMLTSDIISILLIPKLDVENVLHFLVCF